MIELPRRSFIAGLGMLVAAPAIVKAASLMPCAPTETLRLPRNSLLTVQGITREAVALFGSNLFLREIDKQYYERFAADGAKIGSQLRIRLPNDWVTHSIDATAYTLRMEDEFRRDFEFMRSEQWSAPQVPVPGRGRRARCGCSPGGRAGIEDASDETILE